MRDDSEDVLSRRDTLSGWFFEQARLLNEQMREYHPRQYGEGKLTPVKFLPRWAQDWLHSMPVAYVSLRDGSEAPYLVLLTRNLDKFHEIYLAE